MPFPAPIADAEYLFELLDRTSTLCVAGATAAVCGVIAYVFHRRSRGRYEKQLAAAAEREQFLRTVITSEPSCVKTVSRDMKLLSMNPAGLAVIEAESFEAVKGADLSAVLHPDHLQDFTEMNERVFRGESVSLRFRIIGLKGTERWMETFAAPMRGTDGEILYHLAVTNEITDRVVMEQRLVQARDAAVAGTRAKSEFLANMSHEIRTPMNSILGWCEVLQEQYAAVPETAGTLSVIERNSRHLLSILDDLLDLSRIESGKAVLQQDVVDPAVLIEDVRSALMPKAAGKGIGLLAMLAGDLPGAVCTDRQRVQQVLVNLTNNAIKFTDEGEVRVCAAVDTSGECRSLVLTVEDTGQGIAPQDLERMFHAFEQADATMCRQHGGVGLGLAISRSIADLLGGTLTLSSELARGTRAELRLPLDVVSPRGGADAGGAGAVSVARQAAATDSEALRGRRVLLAEDGADNQLLLTHLLKRAGCEVEVAVNGREAVEMAHAATEEQRAFDLVLMDLQMPELDGLSATRELRDSGFRSPIVALTAHAMVGDREKALSAGCDGYLTKPVRGRELLAELSCRLPSGVGAT